MLLSYDDIMVWFALEPQQVDYCCRLTADVLHTTAPTAFYLRRPPLVQAKMIVLAAGMPLLHGDGNGVSHICRPAIFAIGQFFGGVLWQRPGVLFCFRGTNIISSFFIMEVAMALPGNLFRQDLSCLVVASSP